MALVVQKYGGTSVGTPERIESVASQIKERVLKGDKLVVVVSAMMHTTDELLSLAHSISDNPPERELDMLLTAGERISMALLSIALRKLGVDAISFTGSQSGIITDNCHTRARIVEIKPERIIGELEKGKVVIVAGFQGVSAGREVTTLGRGGSDTTAVALATAIGADVCEMYKNVPGVFTADPSIVDGAKPHFTIPFEQMLDYAYFGADIVHPRAVELAWAHNIKIIVRSSTDNGQETVIQEVQPMETPNITGVSIRNNITYFNVLLDNEADELFRIFEKERINLDEVDMLHLGRGRYSLCFWVPDERKEHLLRLLPRFNPEVRDDLSLVAIVGHNISWRVELVSDVMKIARGFPVERVRTTHTSITLLVEKGFAEELARKLHERLVK
ncbi:aspartate kinase [bacterium]|nr:aspartate kinase [bacterium]